MEGYARHSRSHFKSAPLPPSSAGAGTAYYKKGYTNGAAAAAAGGNSFLAYDDVFGGPPKFGATPFAPRAEDYSEIFGSFRSSRSSSIPMLDLPPVDDSVAAFEVLGCSGLEYSDIFGGFDFADFAASYDELFRRSDGSEESSDDAWTPVGTESPSGESDPYASSGRNQYFLNGDFHETLEDKVFDLSNENVNLGTAEDSELTHEAQLSSAPEYTYVFEGSAMRKEDNERYSSGVADDIILCEDSSGNVSVETPWQTTSSKSHNCVVKESHEYDEKAGEAHGISLSPNFVSFNDVSLRAEPSHLSPASGLPSTIVDRKKNPASGSPPTKSNTTETIFGGGLFDFFDVELNADAGSSSIASAEAIKEAMDKAKLKINSAKELMKRKKDGVKDMPFMNNELNSDGKVRMVFDESSSRDDELQSTHEREFDAVKISGDNVQFVSEASRVLPDPLQPEDAVSTAAEPVQNQSSSLDPDLTEGDGDWKVTTECYELVNNGNSKTEPSLPDNIKKPGQEMNNCHFCNANGKTMHTQKLEQNVEGIDPSIKEDKDSESADEACNPRENRRRLRASKPASRNAFHQKMVKLAQDVHETVIGGHVETVKKGKEGHAGDGVNWEKNERKFDQAALHKEESFFTGSEISSEEDFVQADFNNKGKEDCRLKENERREAEVEVREETLKRVEELAEREDNWRGLDDAYQNEEKEEACARKEAEAMAKMLSPRDENLSVLNGALEKQDSDVRSKKADEESNVRENEIREKEAQKTHQCEENAAMLKCYGKKLKDSVDSEDFEKHDVATENMSEESINAAGDHPTMRKRSERSDGTCKNEDEVDNYEMKEPLQTSEVEKSQKIYECSAMNEEQKMESKGDLQAEIKITDQDSNKERNLHIESEDFISVGPSTLNEIEPEMACEHEELESSTLSSSPYHEDIISSDLACESEENLENHVAEDMPVGEEKAEFRSGTLYGQMESKVADMAGQPMMSERNESAQKQYLSSNINQNVGKEAKAANGNLAAEDREMAEKLKRKEENERERLRELQLEKERERERELEKERLRKLEEERENELEKLRLRRLEELREREREKELEKEHLRKLEEERQREREKDLEKERLRKLEEEWEREREREKDRMGVELNMSAAQERAAVERATAEVRQRAMAEARERLEKACAEAREKNSLGKASKEAQLRAERAAVERATAEARERAMEKAIAERGVERSVSEKFSSSFRNVELRHCQSSNDLWNSDKSDGVEGESAQRCRARLERHRRTVERVAKALAEKNMRDLIAQREQAERNRFAETLDADIKRWSSGKEGNLRALLSTLQYILGSDSGWQPIPLTEVITSAAVKKAYRKATLCVHPDKLQQRGATIQQKYICEKVFDLLKDAWNRFNSEER